MNAVKLVTTTCMGSPPAFRHHSMLAA